MDTLRHRLARLSKARCSIRTYAFAVPATACSPLSHNAQPDIIHRHELIINYLDFSVFVVNLEIRMGVAWRMACHMQKALALLLSLGAVIVSSGRDGGGIGPYS